jgi:hypothetical protein
MQSKKVVIAGATGLVGNAALRHFGMEQSLPTARAGEG